MAEDRQVRNRSLISNSKWNLVAFACALAAQFAIVPFVIRWIGLAEFGRAGLVLAVWAPLMLIGTVLGQATTREMSARLGSSGLPEAQRVFDTAILLCSAVCAVGGLVLFAAGPSILSALVGAAQPRQALRAAFLFAGIGWIAQQAILVLQGACSARQDFRRIAQLGAFSACATVLLTLAFTASAPSAEGYLAGVAASFVASLLAWLWTSRTIALSRPRWPTLHRQELASLMHFGKWQSLAQLAGSFGNQIDRYALGALAPAIVVGQYNAANRLQEAAYMGVMKAGEILFPHFAATANDELARREAFFLTASWVVATVSAMFLAPLVPLAHSMLTLWVGPATADGGAQLLRTLVLGGIVGCGSNVFTYYAMGTGQNAPVAWLSLTYALLTVLATIVLIVNFGPYAAGGGLLVASVVRVAASLWLTRRLFFQGLRWSSLLVSSVVPLLAGLAVALGLTATALSEVAGWPALVAAYALAAIAVLVTNLILTALWPVGRETVARVISAARAHRAPG